MPPQDANPTPSFGGFGIMEGVFGQGLGTAYDASDVLFISSGSSIYRLEDLNGDNDFWDAGTDALDAGESTLFAENLPGGIASLTFAANGDLFVASSVANPNGTRTGHVTVISEVGPPPTVPGLNVWGLIAMGLLLAGLTSIGLRRRQAQGT